MMKIGAGVLGLVGWVAVAGPAAADCGSRRAAVDAALHAGDLAGGARLIGADGWAKDCNPDERLSARRSLALSLVAEAKRLRADPKRSEEMARLIKHAADLTASWEASRDLGDLDVAQLNYSAAALDYQKAIKLIAEQPDRLSDAIPKANKTYLARRAEETRHLAASGANGTLVAALTARDGTMGGVFSPVIDRGPVAVQVPAPILFVFNSDTFTPVGEQAAAEFANFLIERKPSSIVVTGHTDHVGDDAFNMALSQRRASKVVDFLQSKGVTGTMTIVAKGFHEPRILSDAHTYTPAQIDELNRRVEFDWKS